MPGKLLKIAIVEIICLKKYQLKYQQLETLNKIIDEQRRLRSCYPYTLYACLGPLFLSFHKHIPQPYTIITESNSQMRQINGHKLTYLKQFLSNLGIISKSIL